VAEAIGWATVVDDDADEIPDAVDIDAGQLDRLIDTMASSADAARATWQRVWAQQERMARYEGEGFSADALDEVDTLVFEALQAAEAAWSVVDTATTAYWSRQPDEFTDADDDEAGPERTSPGVT
jgi:hypothetical protein